MLWRRLRHELSNMRDATLLFAAVASFVAWILTDLLKALFG